MPLRQPLSARRLLHGAWRLRWLLLAGCCWLAALPAQAQAVELPTLQRRARATAALALDFAAALDPAAAGRRRAAARRAAVLRRRRPRSTATAGTGATSAWRASRAPGALAYQPLTAHLARRASAACTRRFASAGRGAGGRLARRRLARSPSRRSSTRTSATTSNSASGSTPPSCRSRCRSAWAARPTGQLGVERTLRVE